MTRFLAAVIPTSHLLAAALCLGGASSVMGQAKPFPDAWFYSEDKRPEALRSLEGKPATDLTIDKWIGDATTVKEHKGKVVVVDFWATWCPPCMASIPHNVEMVNKHKDQGLVFIGVHDSKRGWDKAAGVVGQKGINYPVGLDKGGASTKAYNLQFWPTYVVIDRTGTIRGAGFKPSNVEDAVKVLLAEPAPAGVGAKPGATGFPADWFIGRTEALKALEGKPAGKTSGDEWLGAPAASEMWKDRVVVLYFFSPGDTAAMRWFEQAATAQKDLDPKQVVFAGIAQPQGDWERFKKALAAQKIALSVLHDPAFTEKTPGKRARGETAESFGLDGSTTTLVIDRSGKIREAGLRPDKIKPVVTALLAEKPAAATESKPAEPAKPAGK